MAFNYTESLTVLILIFYTTIGHGQYVTTSSGGTINSSNGYSTSYTMGEIFNQKEDTSNFTCKMGILQFPVKISTYVGIIPSVDIRFYPNPVKDFMMIDFGDYQNLSYGIYTIEGKLIQKDELDNSVIDLRNLPNGVYVISVENDKVALSNKFQKFNNL